jgi:hypothetical protein
VDLFKGRHFDQEIIVLCVRWYLRYKPSARDLVQMIYQVGLYLFLAYGLLFSRHNPANTLLNTLSHSF